jgi:hypothetical protein
VVSISFVLASILLFVAYLVSSLMSHLRARTEELAQANLSCELRAADLSDLNARLKELDAART